MDRRKHYIEKLDLFDVLKGDPVPFQTESRLSIEVQSTHLHMESQKKGQVSF